jgi:AraC-like DNA-binding protein
VLDEHHLLYVEQGHGWLEYGGYRGALSAGAVAALCLGVAHDLRPRPDDPLEITWVVLAGAGFERLAAHAGLTRARPCVPIGSAPEPRAIFRELRQALPGCVWRAHALLWALLARIAAATGSAGLGAPPPSATQPKTVPDAPGRPIGPPPAVPDSEALAADDPAIARAIDVARMHLREPDLRLDHLARAASLGRSRFGQRFRRATGLPPRQYLERLRMEEARRLLEEDLPVTRVAELAGFEDPLYFSRRFRALHGVAPTAYRAVAHGARP